MSDSIENAIDLALNGHSFLILGSAGTGKSSLVKRIAKELSSSGKKVQITCSTGIACQIYCDACTIHQFSGIGDGRFGPDEILQVLLNNRKYDKTIDNIKKCDTIIIDECSMLSERTLDSISKACSVKSPNYPFGGIQVILAGDFFQLPPVPNLQFKDHGNFCFLSNIFKSVFQHYVLLTKNLRQNDALLIQTIQQVQKGHLSNESKMFILSLQRKLPPTGEIIHLFSKNDLCNDHNRKCLLQLEGDLVQYSAKDSGCTAELKHCPVEKNLWLKIGAPVICTKNLSCKVVNGLQGKILKLEHDGPTVHFSTANITLKLKKESFTVFDPVHGNDIAARLQYPLKLAFALTIHKSQGMTLNRVEVDCTDIFQAGQFGVALSRVTSSEGLRVSNFHDRYIIPPPKEVTSFMDGLETSVMKDDLSCCKLSKSYDELNTVPSLYCIQPKLQETQEDEDDADLEDSFTDAIRELSEYIDVKTFKLPEQFTFNLNETKFQKEITEFQKQYNFLVDKVYERDCNNNESTLTNFIKKVFYKLESMISVIAIDAEDPRPVSEKHIAQFYRKVHEYSVSLEFQLNCIELFSFDPVFTDIHKSICYNILEAVRIYFLQEKANIFQQVQMKIQPRTVTDASKARIRYVAGYCVAKLKNKYSKMKCTNTFTESGQGIYKSSKICCSILCALIEHEHYLHTTSSQPDSLIDINRRQNTSRGLTSVSDNCFFYFVELTNGILTQLNKHNFVEYGQNLHSEALKNLKSDTSLYVKFVKLVSQNAMYSDATSVQAFLLDITSFIEQVEKIHLELLQKYLMVMFSQFRKDIKSTMHVEKTLAHRKQIKVNKSKKNVQTTASSSPSQTTGLIKDKDENTCSLASTSEMASLTEDQNTIKCIKCHSAHENDQWIQCDLCDTWLHRKCAGLSNSLKWKKYSKPDSKWYCIVCANKK